MRMLLLVITSCQILAIQQFISPTHAASDKSSELFCGETWIDAFENCHQPCPSGLDSECTQNVLHTCHGYTGCAAAPDDNNGGGATNNGVGNNNGGSSNSISVEGYDEADDTYKNNMCGTSWLTAMLSCSKPCPPGTDCAPGETCFAATNCDEPMEPIISKMIMSLLGDYEAVGGGGPVNMGTAERMVFSESVLQFLADKMEENKVAINGADITGQSYAEQAGGSRSRRMLQWNDTITGSIISVELSVEQQQQQRRNRRLPSYSSALDVSMTVTGEYRPPPYQDMDILIEDSINRASKALVNDIQDRGSRGGTRFFESVEDLTALSVKRATQRPTKEPTLPPTMRPTQKPTPAPTREPSVSPTTSPSLAPTRASEQMLQSGFGADLYEGTAESFGNLFEVKTKPGAETVLIKGLDFYSAANANTRVSYEVWTKEGSWQGFEGKLDSFTKIAQGKVRSRGTCDENTASRCNFARIPFDKFTNVPIRGGGGSRSFYVTLSTNDITYKVGQSTSTTDFSVQMETPDIELYEGAGVLVYPFSEATEEKHYRKPRGFLGRIWYDRNPCEDGSQEWPCQTRSPVTQFQLSTNKPTRKPTTLNPTKQPTTLTPTVQPTKQLVQPAPPASTPTSAPQNATVIGGGPTTPPSPKPVIEFSFDEADVALTNIVLTLHNVQNELMDDREKKKYSEVLTDFLRSQPSLQGASVDVLNVTVWHQEIVATDDNKLRGNGKRPANSDSRALQGDDGLEATTAAGIPDESIGDISSSEASVEDTEIIAESTSSADSTRVSMDVTTIVKTVNSILPSDVTDVLLLHVIQNNADLVELFHKKSFYSHFLDINDISGRIIMKVTNPPSSAPTTLSQMIATNKVTVESINGEDDVGGETSVIRVVGVGIGILWCILTLGGWCYLAKARRDMQNENMLRSDPTNQTQERKTAKLEKEMLCMHDSGCNDPHLGDSDDTKLGDDSASHGSGEHAGFTDEEAGSIDCATSTQPVITFADLLPSQPASAQGEGGSTQEHSPQRQKKNSTFNGRLQHKLSGVHDDAPHESQPPQRQRRNTFNDRLMHKLSSVHDDAPKEKRKTVADRPHQNSENEEKKRNEALKRSSSSKSQINRRTSVDDPHDQSGALKRSLSSSAAFGGLESLKGEKQSRKKTFSHTKKEKRTSQKDHDHHRKHKPTGNDSKHQELGTNMVEMLFT